MRLLSTPPRAIAAACLLATPAAARSPAEAFIEVQGGRLAYETCGQGSTTLVLLHDGRDRGRVNALAESLWYPLWDSSVRLDHSVRTPAECADVAGLSSSQCRARDSNSASGTGRLNR